MSRPTARAALVALALLALTGCTAAPATAPTAPDASAPAAGDGHGAVDGAAQVAEPQLRLVAVDDAGKVGMHDLLTGEDADLGAVTAPAAVTTDGRYVFAVDDTGVDIIDSGVWTWDHVDHFHYYEATPRPVGRVDGSGRATISAGLLSTAGTTGVFFPASGDALLLDNAALARGEVDVALRVPGTPHDGLIAPIDGGAVVTDADADGRVNSLRVVTADGSAGESIPCPEAKGSITTRVGLVIGCADGAVLITATAAAPVTERIPYPAGGGTAATSFDGRKGRPTVAGLGDGSGIWLLDTRERTWTWLATSTPVVRASAVDDSDDHVLALGADGTVQVYDGDSGLPLAATEPLLAGAPSDPDLAGAISLTVDAQRAYVNAADAGVAYEIDYADGARIARSLTTPTRPVHLVEVGR